VDSAGLLNSLFSALPGFGEQMRGAVEELVKDDRLPLKVQIAFSIPNLAALAGQRQPGMAIPAGLDLSAPLLEMTYELAELSTVPLSDALFGVPTGFRSVSMQEIANGRLAETTIQRPVPPPFVPATPPAALVTMPPGVYKVGGGVTAPRLLTKKEPEYTQEARSDHVQGKVVLRVVVGEDGKGSIVQIVNSLRPDLDQKAMDAVSQWTFTPGTKDGKPVKTIATIEVNFRLLDRPPAAPLQ
jgi:TonB family protein